MFRQMSKKKKLIPELRFPEFKKDGEWEEKAISKIGDTVNGLSGKKGADFGSGKPYVQYKQVFDKSFIDFAECGRVSVGNDENQNELQKGDILFTTSSETPDEVGFASVIINQPNEPTYLNSFCFVLRPFNLEKLNPNFSRYLFRSPIYRKSVNAIAQGAIRYNLSKGAFLDLELPVPKPKEQQKIAACLSSLDDLIEAHNNKLEALKDHKKGLMQNLFPQKSEKVPKLRFPEFVNDGDWEEKDLGAICNITNGKANAQDHIENGKYPLFDRSEAIKASDQFIFDCETVIIPGEGTRFIPKYYKGKFNLHQREYALIDILCSGKFLYYSMLHRSRLLSQKAVQSTVLSLRLPILQKFTIEIPKLKEQKKIADCLSSLDNLITTQTEKIEQLQQHKKGLMQGLFPKNDE